jgi:ribosome maturation factor RimP
MHMTATTDRVSAIVEPIAERLGLSLYDVDQPGGTLRVMLDAHGGVDLDTLADATREISSALDAEQPMAGSYTLEVSSPGLERPLRRADHWRGAVGDRVRVKLMPGVEGDRRADGVLVGFDGNRATIDTDGGERTIDIADVSGARTVFEWNNDKGGQGARKGGGAAGQKGSKPAGKSKKPKPAEVPTVNPTTESSEESQ